ncbi:Peptide chain release factor subunit 1 [uncultured archaeon]|nr:Peptide chain release factor subunit 1 [uncultured archaeon]
MKLLKRDFKHGIKIKPETLDDLWNLKNILAEGDVAGAKTIRTIQRTETGEKKPVYLKLKVEKMQFDESGNALRLTGKITEAPEEFEHGYHTISVEPNTILDIEKEWTPSDKIRLDESLTYKGLKFLICVVDERRADFAKATELEVKIFATVTWKAAGKEYGALSPEIFYDEVIKLIDANSNVDKIIIAGPGFAKENIMALIKKRKLAWASKCVPAQSSITGKTGVNEVIKRGGLEKVLAESRLSFETNLVEKFLEHLGKETGLAVYGKKEVAQAAENGAIAELLVSDKMLRNAETEKIISEVEKNSGAVHIINSTHESGEKLFNLGGFGAVLRYKVR